MWFLVERLVPQIMQHNRQQIQNQYKVSISEKAFQFERTVLLSNLTYGIDHMIRKMLFDVLPLQESSNLRQSVRCYLNQNKIWVFKVLSFCNNESLSLQHSLVTISFLQSKSRKNIHKLKTIFLASYTELAVKLFTQSF